jgi:hypothetical protein
VQLVQLVRATFSGHQSGSQPMNLDPSRRSRSQQRKLSRQVAAVRFLL